MITIYRSDIKEDKISCVILNNGDLFFKTKIRIVEGNCDKCGEIIENRHEARFKEATGSCFNCHPRNQFWGDVTRCKVFVKLEDAEGFIKIVNKYEMFSRIRLVLSQYTFKYEVYYSFNRARLYCLTEYGVDIGYPQFSA